MAQQLDFIRSITVSNLSYPLYDHLSIPNKCYFSLDPVVLGGSGQVSSYPAAITRAARISVQFSNLQVLQPNHNYILTATLLGQPFLSTQVIRKETVELTDLGLSNPIAGGRPKSLPWMLWGDVQWTLKLSATDAGYKCSTTVEIFVLYPGLPASLDTYGIPLAFLRMGNYMGAWMNVSEQNTDWPSFAVNAIATDPRLEYETFAGSRKYSSWTDGLSLVDSLTQGGFYCWFDLWLSDVIGVAGKGATHTMNCYDLAVLCQVIMSLGDPSREIKMKYLSPFGFINRTRLIGKKESPRNPANPEDLCNNPFYEHGPPYDPTMISTNNPPRRSQFGNHMFLSIAKAGREVVMDACCGPELGARSLDTYPGLVIDQNRNLYTFVGRNRPGVLQDIVSGKGVIGIITSYAIERNFVKDPLQRTLVEKLEDRMTKTGAFLHPYTAALAGERKMTATWTLIPRDGSGEVYILNIFTYKTDVEVDAAFKRLTSVDPANWKYPVNNDPTDCYNDNMAGSLRIFFDKKRLYIATLDAKKGKSMSTKQLKEDLRIIINDSLSIHPSPPSYIQSAQLSQNVIPRVKGVAKIEIKLTANGVNSVMGLNIQVTAGMLLLVNSSTQGNPTILEFLCRKAGTETVQITVYDGNLQSQATKIPVKVLA